MKHFYLILYSFLFLNCSTDNRNSDIEGVWISAYEIDEKHGNPISHFTTIIGIKNNQIEIRSIGNPKNGLNPTNFKTSFDRSYFGIEIEDYEWGTIYLDNITKDSLVVSYSLDDNIKEVFRKVKEHKNQPEWSPKNKSYQWKGNKTTVYSHFLKNGLFVDYNKQNERVSVGHWNTMKIQNSSFFVVDKASPITLTIDSLKESSVYFSIFEKEKYSYKFEEESLSFPNQLIGDWVLADTEFINGKPPPPPIPQNDLKRPKMGFIKIEQDTIRYKNNGVLLNKKWELGGAGNLLIFPDDAIQTSDSSVKNTLTKKEHRIRKNIWKIDRLTQNELIIKTEYNVWDFTKRLRYIRK